MATTTTTIIIVAFPTAAIRKCVYVCLSYPNRFFDLRMNHSYFLLLIWEFALFIIAEVGVECSIPSNLNLSMREEGQSHFLLIRFSIGSRSQCPTMSWLAIVVVTDHIRQVCDYPNDHFHDS